MSMIEKVAMALHLEERKAQPVEFYYSLARAAIAAMREPTSAMVDAGEWAMPATEGYSLPDDCPGVWRAMVDAALANPQAPLVSSEDANPSTNSSSSEGGRD